MADEALVQVTQTAAVRTLTLNRPKALNSFTGPMHEALRTALDAAAAEAEVRCVVLTGAGRGFCAGQDLADPSVAPALEPGAKPTDIGGAIERYYKPLALQIRAMPVPVVAAVNGVAAGAGANIALGCDVVIGTVGSFIQAFSKIGWCRTPAAPGCCRASSAAPPRSADPARRQVGRPRTPPASA